MDPVLKGIRVLDWTTFQAGPAASALLAEMGAEVIHVERLGQGDGNRGLVLFGQATTVRGVSIQFEESNHNKKGICLNLQQPKAVAIMHDLVAKCDVFVTNFRPRAAKNLGLDYDTLSQLNPMLVYAQSSCLGRKGPEKDAPGFAVIGEARSGAMFAGGEGTLPVRLGVAVGDRVAAAFLAHGITSALYAREKQGKGQAVFVSQLGAMIWIYGAVVTQALWGAPLPRPGRMDLANPLYAAYECRDGRWLQFCLLQSDRHWPDFCQGLGMPELASDPRFCDVAQRRENARSLVLLLERTFATRTRDEWEERFREEGDFPFTRINDVTDLATDPQVIENGYIVDWEHPVAGPIKVLGKPIEFTETPYVPMSAAPEFGQHTEEVLVNLCGYSWDHIVQLRTDGVI